MELWEHLLNDDQRCDLSQPRAAWDWLRSRPWGMTGDKLCVPSNWTRNLHALRSLARRVRAKRLRLRPPEGMDHDLVADRIALEYVQLMHVCLVCAEGGVLSSQSFRGIQLLPTYALAQPMKLDPSGHRLINRLAVQGGVEHVQSLLLWLNDGELFWQLIFHSLLAGGGPAICQTCGAMLGDTTPTGRKKKQAQCQRCRWRAWSARQSPAKKRARWRADYKKRSKGGALKSKRTARHERPR
jgi:hypothetical protein